MMVVAAIQSSKERELIPPNIVTSVRPGAREIAVTEWPHLVD